MKKPYNFTEKSVHKCIVCSTLLKQNVIARKLTPPSVCFKCYTLRRLQYNAVNRKLLQRARLVRVLEGYYEAEI